MTQRKLIRDETGEEVKIGDTLTSFRDEKGVLTGIHDFKNKITVKMAEASMSLEYYPSVFDCTIKDLEPEEVSSDGK